VAGSPHLANLTSLDLLYSCPGDEGIAALVRSPNLTRLTELNVGVYYSPLLTVTGMRALSGWHALAGLLKLAASTDDDGAALLAACPAVSGLRDLSLTTGRIGDAGAAALAGSPHLGGLLRLDLHSNQIKRAGARALADSPHLTNLRELQIRGNEIGEEAADALRARFGEASVKADF
jgi:hypothetical protein